MTPKPYTETGILLNGAKMLMQHGQAEHALTVMEAYEEAVERESQAETRRFLEREREGIEEYSHY